MQSVKAPVELWALSAIFLIGVFLVSPGFFTIDEAIYYIGARAIAEHGTLGIDNGFEQFRSENLKLRFLVEGPQGLTPQYPAGSALLGGLLLPLLGPRAFILLNALAAIATLFTVRKICLSHFGSETVARLAAGLLVAGSFWVEYALGQWPHVLSAFLAVQAYWFALRHLDADGEGWLTAFMAGLFSGLGMLFRIDSILAVPAIGLILLTFAPHYVRSSLWFGAGVLPSFALMSGLNYLKFGSANPLSYGRAGGNTDLTTYGALLAALCVGVGLLLLFRKSGWRVHRGTALASIAIVGVTLLLIPATSVRILQIWNGFMALVVDLRAVDDHRPGVGPGPGGTVSFLGLAKKALGQSMPWIGLAAILLTSRIQQSERRAIAMLLIFIATFAAPFVGLSWHGGGGGNMRYFLPMLPAICILCAKLLHDLWGSVPNAMISAAAGVWVAMGLGVAWTFFHPSAYAGFQQIVSTYMLLAVALAAVAAGLTWRFRQVAGRLTIALFAGAFVVAMTFATSDFRATAKWRATAHGVSQTIATLPPKSLVITRPEWMTAWIPGNGSIGAVRDPGTQQIDRLLVIEAINMGYRVFLTSFETDARTDAPPGFELSATSFVYPGGRMVELRRRIETGSAQP